MCPIGRKDQLVDLKMCICRNVPFMFFLVAVYGCCLMMHVSFILCYALKKKDYILISVHCYTQF